MGKPTGGAIGIQEAMRRYGTPEELLHRLRPGADTLAWWQDVVKKRSGEVVLFIRRPNGKFLLHTKAFYPEGVYRVPSGGIKRGEDLIAAVFRETVEETSLTAEIDRFLGIVRYEIVGPDEPLLFASYLFLLRELGGTLGTHDTDEQITGYREVTTGDLAVVARDLENMDESWRNWGQFRAICHRFARQLLTGERDRTRG